ncbi:phosphatase PAP2 family protein [Paenibacillus puerhi]|uniref:phosphatase PAP2 family protein n=1 Tax=Paenibacillus puerhi TaxID=2692622 RepID=UPI0013596CB1|nr:phosphatase PAP2 family protein [Paenibacillus puerhi]
MTTQRFPFAAAAAGLLLWAGLVLGLGSHDLSISRAAANPASPWARWFEVYGEHPAILLVWISGQLLFSSARLLSCRLRLLQQVPAALVQLAAGLALVHMTTARALHQELTASGWALAALLLLAAAIIVQLLLRRVSANRLARFNQAAWLTLLLVGGELALVHSLKWIWGRVRFRDLLPGYTDYTPWHMPMGPTGNRSFPSSHAANSWTLVLLPVYASAALARPAVIRTAWAAALLWASATSYSRLVAGAHYASDLLFGTGITLALFLALRHLLSERPGVVPPRLAIRQEKDLRS